MPSIRVLTYELLHPSYGPGLVLGLGTPKWWRSGCPSQGCSASWLWGPGEKDKEASDQSPTSPFPPLIPKSKQYSLWDRTTAPGKLSNDAIITWEHENRHTKAVIARIPCLMNNVAANALNSGERDHFKRERGFHDGKNLSKRRGVSQPRKRDSGRPNKKTRK